MINPLSTYSPAVTSGAPDIAKKCGSPASSPFDALLSSLRSTEGGAASKGQQAAAELLRIEMMQNSLSLAGSDNTSTSQVTPALEALLSGSAQYCKASHPAQPPSGTEVASSAAAPEVAPQASAEAGEIERTAAQYLGTPYRFGGEGADGIDCSSFVQQVFREHQIDLPRTAREQSKVGGDVAQADLKKGDLVFFHTYASYPSHVGIYLGDGKMIHASSGKGEVTVSDMNSSYYRSRFMGAKRVA